MGMRENYTLIRLYIDAPLASGGRLELPKEQRHYLINVLRKKTRDELRVFNGADGEWLARIVDVSKKSAQIEILERLRAPKPSPDIILCFAPLRKHRTAFIAEKATELGVSVLQPVITARTQFPKINADKMRAQIIEAAEQTERLDIPSLAEVMSLDAMLAAYNDRRIFFADEAQNAQHTKLALEAINATPHPASILRDRQRYRC